MPSHLGHGMYVPYLDRGPRALSEYHTITNLPFEIKSKLDIRYELMNRPSTANLPFFHMGVKKSESPRASVAGFSPTEFQEDNVKLSGIDYAKFLKEHDRTVGPTGFLDSKRYTHTFNVRSSNLSHRSQNGQKHEKEPTTVVALINQTASDQREFDRKIKIVDSHMWQHKQEGRELKRLEGDVVKKKRTVQRTVKEIESSTNKKMQEEEKWLAASLEKSEKARANTAHAKEERTRQKINKPHSDLQQNMDKTLKLASDLSEAEQLYRNKLTELQLRKSQLQKITQQFQEQLHRKEAEACDLATELSTLAIQMNTESMKGHGASAELKRQGKVQTHKYLNEDRTHNADLDKKLRRSEGINRASENRRRQASANLANTKAHLSEKSREGDRRVTDNRNSVENNIAAQKKLQEAAEALKLDKQKKEYQRSVQAHVLRKKIAIERSQSARQKSAEERQATWKKAFDQNYRDFVKRRTEGLHRTFNRIVQRDSEMEHQLSQKCRQHEKGRKGEEQAFRKLQDQLLRSRARNTNKLRENVVEFDSNERKLETGLVRSQAKLQHAAHQRTTSESVLRKYRSASKESEHVYGNVQKQNKRLKKVQVATAAHFGEQAMAAM